MFHISKDRCIYPKSVGTTGGISHSQQFAILFSTGQFNKFMEQKQVIFRNSLYTYVLFMLVSSTLDYDLWFLWRYGCNLS